MNSTLLRQNLQHDCTVRNFTDNNVWRWKLSLFSGTIYALGSEIVHDHSNPLVFKLHKANKRFSLVMRSDGILSPLDTFSSDFRCSSISKDDTFDQQIAALDVAIETTVGCKAIAASSLMVIGCMPLD